jgi:transposase
VHVTFTQDLPSLISGMEDAWAFFGGITRKVVIDNLKGELWGRPSHLHIHLP